LILRWNGTRRDEGKQITETTVHRDSKELGFWVVDECLDSTAERARDGAGCLEIMGKQNLDISDSGQNRWLPGLSVRYG
jgi:hypothetical protein